MGAMLPNLLAALGAAVCLALLVHMFLPAPQRQKLDMRLGRLWRAAQARWQQGWKKRSLGKPVPVQRQTPAGAPPAALPGTAPRLPRQGSRPLRAGQGGSADRPVPLAPLPRVPAAPKPDPEVERQAELEAQAVIDRARRQSRGDPPVERDGNVYRPDAFKPRPPKDKLH